MRPKKSLRVIPGPETVCIRPEQLIGFFEKNFRFKEPSFLLSVLMP